jgi:hypothetical protein
MNLTTETTLERGVATIAKAVGHPARVRICASRDRLTELHDLLGILLDEAVEVDTHGCD